MTHLGDDRVAEAGADRGGDDSAALARAQLHNGGLGELQQVTCYYTAGAANSGSHLFDLLRLYLGDAAWVQGRESRNPSRSADDPNLDGWIGFRSGAVAAIQACDVAAYMLFELTLLGTTGRLPDRASPKAPCGVSRRRPALGLSAP